MRETWQKLMRLCMGLYTIERANKNFWLEFSGQNDSYLVSKVLDYLWTWNFGNKFYRQSELIDDIFKVFSCLKDEH